MLVSVSFLSSNNIPKTLEELNNTSADFIHVDVMDGKYVKNKTMPTKEMLHIKDYTPKRLDVHLMVEKPLKYIREYAKLNTGFITIHQDIKEDLITSLKEIRSYGIKSGLAVNPNIEIKEIVPYLPYIDLILIMGVIPGMGGQEFIKETISKLEEAKKLKDEYPQFSLLVSVDGGINGEVKELVKDYVDIVVSGSYVINSSDIEAKVNSLR